MSQKERLIFAEFHDGKPFRLVIDPGDGKGYDEYDVEYCRRDDECYKDECGGYNPKDPIHFRPTVDEKNRYWVADGFKVTLGWPETKKALKPPAKYQLTGLPKKWPERDLLNLTEYRCEYCSLCDDWFPDVDYRDRMCPHLFDCRKCDQLSTEDDPCPCQARRNARIRRMRYGILRRKVTDEVFRALAVDRFGEDQTKWAFACPVCRRVATQAEWIKAGKKLEAGRTCLNHSDDFLGPARCPVYGDEDGTDDLLPVVVEFEGSKNSYMDLAPRPRDNP